VQVQILAPDGNHQREGGEENLKERRGDKELRIVLLCGYNRYGAIR